MLPEALDDTKPEASPGQEPRAVATQVSSTPAPSDTVADNGAPNTPSTGEAATGGDIGPTWKIVLKATESPIPPDPRRDEPGERLEIVDLESKDDER